MSREHKRKRNSIPRIAFVGLTIIIQIVWLIVMAVKLNAHSAWISACVNLLSIVVVLRLYGRHTSTAMKMPWIMLILAAPVMGLSLFLLFDILGDPGRAGKRIRRFREKIEGSLPQDEAVLARLESENRAAGNQFHYLSVHENWPVYENTSVRYLGDGAETLEAMKADLEKAEKFIFMEYFIVADNSAFQEIREILVRKARQGVEVRLMYDDIGSLGYVNLRFARGLSEDGIRCRVFNPAVPVVNLFLNHRDHRKTTVIDGKMGYTGGYNLADEYFGRAQPYGVWKDTGLRLEGEAVRSLTAIFLQMWDIAQEPEFEAYLKQPIPAPAGAKGFAAPYGDCPLDGERVGELVYIDLLNRARKYIHLMTPYLILDGELETALKFAAERGVDVHLILPGKPDKRIPYALAKTHYAALIRSGVKISEWVPGFVHAKVFVVDDREAVVGTINLDYRSLYHHFEDAVWMVDAPCIPAIEDDFQRTLTQCRTVEATTQSIWQGQTLLRLTGRLVKAIAPLL